MFLIFYCFCVVLPVLDAFKKYVFILFDKYSLVCDHANEETWVGCARLYVINYTYGGCVIIECWSLYEGAIKYAWAFMIATSKHFLKMN